MGSPSTTARGWAHSLFSGASEQRARGDRFLGATLTENERDRERLLQMLRRIGEVRRAREAEKKAEKKEGAWFGLGGAAGGAGLGAILAAPTGGLSVAAGAALGGSIGGNVGSAVDRARAGDPGAGENIAGALDSWTANPYFQPQGQNAMTPGALQWLNAPATPGFGGSPFDWMGMN